MSKAKAKKSKREKGGPFSQIDGVVTRNRRVRKDYEILETVECGLKLLGSEIKSVRNGKIEIAEAFARVENGELWLFNAEIGPYAEANLMNHENRRPRKLLLKKAELRKFAEAAQQKGLTLVPTDVHFKRGFAKVDLAVGRGLKKHDSREKIKRETDRREMQQALRRR